MRIRTRYRKLIKALRSLGNVGTLRRYISGRTSKREESRVSVGLRHDVDKRLDIAYLMARFENTIGIQSTYFIRHTASFWDKPDTWTTLFMMQELGHEIGFHNDAVSDAVENGGSVLNSLIRSLAAMREAGLDVRGTSAHGSGLARRHRFLNWYVWDITKRIESHPNYDSVTVDGREIAIPHLRLRQFNLSYESNHPVVGPMSYISDADGTFDMKELRKRFAQNGQIQVSIHPNKKTLKEGLLWARY